VNTMNDNGVHTKLTDIAGELRGETEKAFRIYDGAKIAGRRRHVHNAGMAGSFDGCDVQHGVAYVGSNDPKALWHELGTSRIPPRPFFGGAVAAKHEEIGSISAGASTPYCCLKRDEKPEQPD
jgi:hypothetical protein